MKKTSSTCSGFFNIRALLAFTLGSLGVFLAIFSFRGMPSPSATPVVADTEVRDADQREHYMPTRGPDSKRDDLDRIEQEWNNRLTYPTGHFNPAWVRKAALQDSFIPRRIPAGIRNPKLTLQQNKFDKHGKAGNKSPLALDVNSFIALGPTPEHMTGCTGCFDYGTTEGRVNAIAVDPTTTTNGSIVAYVATDGGGVWKTTNCCSGTTTWTVTTDDASVSTTAIDTLTIDPNNHNTIYAGTGDLNYGSFSQGSQGILKSTNGATSWTVLGANIFGASYFISAGTFPQYDSVGKVRVDPNNSSNVVAGTKRGLWLSYDGGTNWTGPCVTNAFNTQRQDITGLELTNMGGGVTRILAAVGTRGFATTVQVGLDQNGANGLYKGTLPASGCPTDFALISSNANGFVYGAGITTAAGGAGYTTGQSMNAGSGTPYGGNINTGTQLGRMDIAVAPSNPNVIYAQVGQIANNANGGCGNTSGCQLGVWATTDGGTSWSFMTGSAGASLLNCTGGAGDYPQNWYDQGMAVDPNNPDRVFIDTFDVWFATRTGVAFNDLTCGYSGGNVVHVDQHALAFVPGSSDILLKGSDGGVFSSSNASTASAAVDNTWVNMDNGINTVEFYAGDIGANFATAANPVAVAGAQDNGPSSVTFSGTPTGPVQWQMGLGGDGFSGQVNTLGQGPTQAQGTMTVATGGTLAGETFQIGSQVFTWAATRTTTGTVAVSTNTTTASNNIVTAINADIPNVATGLRSGSTVIVTATNQGAGGNSIIFTEAGTNTSVNGTGTLGGTTAGGNPGGTSPVFFEGNNSGGLGRCLTATCTSPGAAWPTARGAWTGDQQSFVLPINMFHGGIPGGDDCNPTCGHLIAGTTRVWETITGNANATTNIFWYVTNPNTGTCTGGTGACLTKGSLGNRSFINQLKYSPKYQSVAIVGTNDGNVQIGFNMGTGIPGQANWVNVTASNAVLPNRPVLGVSLDPGVAAANTPIGYAAVGGFDENTPSTTGHLFRVVCDANCANPVWQNKSGNLPNMPADSVIANPNFPQQVFVGTDIGLYYTDDITAPTPAWFRFNAGLPNVMIWDMSVDRGSTALALWTRSRGAFAWPLPVGPVQGPVTVNSVSSRQVHPGAGTFDIDMGSSVECRNGSTPGNYTVVFTFGNSVTNVDSASVTSGTGSVASSNIGGNPNEYIVNLTGVANAQHLGVALSNVQDSANHFSTSVSGTLHVLVGDTNGDGLVNSADISQTKSKSGQTVDGTNFRTDINVDGSLNSADISLVKSKSGTALP